MKVAFSKCNFCGKYTEKYKDKFGWIRITNSHFEISGNKKIDSNSKYNISIRVLYDCLITSDNDKQLDFCSLSCFIKWLYLSEETDTKFYKEVKEEIFEKICKELIADLQKYLKKNAQNRKSKAK